jgi:DNA repair protein RadC
MQATPCVELFYFIPEKRQVQMKFKHNLNELSRFHPGGSQNFSIEDKTLTQRIVDIFHPLEIKVLDHIVVAGTSYTSMAEKGLLPNQCKDAANYEEILLDPITAKEKRNKFLNIHSR